MKVVCLFCQHTFETLGAGAPFCSPAHAHAYEASVRADTASAVAAVEAAAAKREERLRRELSIVTERANSLDRQVADASRRGRGGGHG